MCSQPLPLQGMTVQSALERQFIAQYLREREISWDEIQTMLPAQARKWMAKASRYASLRLAEIEARSNLVQRIT